jgi:diguanylate cyclase (GGDEF)-like protein
MPGPWWFAAVFTALLLGLARPLVDRFDLVVHDLLAREVVAPLRTPPAPADSLIVAIDDTSLQALGRWPWSRRRHAELIDALRQAHTQAVGYNVLFSEPSANPADDLRLAAAIAAHGQIVLPVVPTSHQDSHAVGALQPLPVLARAAAALGHAETPIDSDGQVRRIARTAGRGATAWEALPVAVQQVAAPRSTATNPASQQRTQQPWWRKQVQLMPASTSPIPQISAFELLRDPGLGTLLTGRVIWVGVTARGIDAPLTVPGPKGSQQISAVQWQAQVHQAMDLGRLVNLASEPVVLAANLLPLLLVALLGRWPRGRFRMALWLLPLLLGVQAIGLGWAQVWLPLGAMTLGGALTLLLSRTLELHATRLALRSERQITEQRLAHDSTHDSLTGLPNRVRLTDQLSRALSGTHHTPPALAVLFIDLDRFGRINDSLGQRQGDAVLETIAARMRRVFRPHDTIARWGNDQFVVLVEDMNSREIVSALAAQLIDQVARDLRVGGVAIACTCSIGIALSPDDARTPDGLLTLSEAAMNRAKSAGGGHFEFYTSGMSKLTRDWLTLENRLRQALASGEFVLHYQVQTHLLTGRPVGVEALLRWRQADGELWAPARFLAITEETGLIVAVGNWVIREATAQLRRWIDAGVAPVPVSVNVSARQCMDSHLIDVITDALEAAAVPAALLKVEITESTAMADLDHLKQLLLRLRRMGVAIALDDFGTGFSSLAHLKRFPVDQIKIDPSFIADIHRDPNGAAIVRATIALAHGLGVPVVAEGVENEAQVRFLREHHCDIVQGYLYGRPCSPEAIREALTSAGAHPRCLHPESHS